MADNWTGRNRAIANARLIAAAPELLMQCKNALAFIQIIFEENPKKPIATMKKLQEAIAKAEGKIYFKEA